MGGCVGQVGAQALNLTRTAWLAAGLPMTVAATTVDAQCGSSQQAANLAWALLKSGAVECAVACGVEVMSRVPMGSTVPRDPDVGKPVNTTYRNRFEFTTQFEGAERIARSRGITRRDCDRFGKESQDRAAAAWQLGAFDTQISAVQLEGGLEANRDEGVRETTLEGLALLKANLDGGVHTPGTSSQIADGASAIILMSDSLAAATGVPVLAEVIDTCVVGCDPVLKLEGPIPATHTLLDRNNLTIGDVDVIEINEAFASVVLAWEREFQPDMSRVNPNGGAIALGHPLGATGTMLVAKATHELVRQDKELGLVTMCCGGGLGTGTLIRRA